MKYFTLFKGEEVHPAPETKVIPAKEFSTLISASEVVEKTKEEAELYRKEVEEECARLKDEAKEAGFEEGLSRWAAQIAALEKEIANVGQEMENTLVPLALAAVKKLIGRELEAKPKTVVDVVATALKPVSQHKKVAIYVNQADLDLVEKERPRIKEIFEHLQSLSIAPREDVEVGGCVIETEAGIINAQLDAQLKALEAAFHGLLKKGKG